ncbi:MAG: hypothetical protein IPF64_18100 [Flavobacteriales bacterium]|nr:hypothetical protein [Flavobacteriales bacterium]
MGNSLDISADRLREGGQLPRHKQYRPRYRPDQSLNERIEGRHVVVVEDIVDTGNTVKHIPRGLRRTIARPA